MKIWTTQTKEFYDELVRRGRVSCRTDMAWDKYPDKYKWMAAQMERRIGPAPSTQTRYPIWGWNQVGSYKKELHPGHVDCTAGDAEYVFLTLEIPDDKVLLSEHTLWECALNNFYIPSGMKDEDSEDMGEREKSWEIIWELYTCCPK